MIYVGKYMILKSEKEKYLLSLEFYPKMNVILLLKKEKNMQMPIHGQQIDMTPIQQQTMRLQRNGIRIIKLYIQYTIKLGAK